MSKSIIYRLCCLIAFIGFTYVATGLVAQNDGTARRHAVKYLDASQLQTRVSKMLAEFGLTARVSKDPASNALIIDGAPEAQRIAAQLISTIDKQSIEPRPASTLPVIQQPATAPNEVRGYAIDPNLLQATTANLAAKYPTARILPDARTGQLVVIAPAQVQAAVARRLGAAAPAATQAATNPAAIRHQLENISPQQLEAKIRELLGDRVEIATNNLGTTSTFNVAGPNRDLASLQLDRNSGILSAKGDGNQVRSWMQLAAALDKSNLQADSGAQVVPVTRADPKTVGEAINLVKQAAAAEGQAVNVVNPAKDKKWGGDLVANIFQQDNAVGDNPAVPAVDENGEPLGRTVLRVEPEEAGLLGPVQIEFIEGLGVFIIKGHKADVARVIEIIEQIEQHTRDTQPEIIVHALQHVNSTVLAELVSNLYDDVFGTRNSPVSITPLDKPNSLLLIGRAESMGAIVSLITKLDTPVPPATTHSVISLIHMSAIDAERQIRNFYSDEPGDGNGGGDPRPGLGTRVRIVADYRTNSLIVHASPRDLAEIKALIAKLDVEDSPATNEIRVFRLVNALAEDLQPVLQEAITGIAAQGGQQQQQQGTGDAVISPQSSKLSIQAVMGDELIDSGILAGITVTADPNVNALVVRAPARSMPLIAELIAQLDQLPNAEAVIKVFEIINGDATSLTQMLQQLFGLEVTAGQASTTTAFNRALSSGSGSAESPLVPLRFSVDLRTNSIISSGALGDLDVVEALILRLDEANVETRRTRVVRLKNANAPDVADAITQYLTTQRSYIQQQLQFAQAISTYEQVNSEVIVVAEAVTNSLIVSATPRYYDEILQVIDDLDFRPAMVMIQVVIAEVELRDDFEFGVEVGLQDSLLFDRGLASVGFDWPSSGMPNDNTPAALATSGNFAGKLGSGFALGRTNPALGYGGLVMSAANESIHVLLRALQSRGRLQILSRPQIMTLDNSSAFVNIGARVPRISSTTLTQFGIQNNAPDEEVGLILDVLPRINNDGLIVMQISAEKSELGLAADGVPISVTTSGEAINSPAINTTTAQTTISAHSGETVVFAGLITKNKTISRRQIPWLGDLPGLGQLFRYDIEEEKRKELLIIMTPHVITGKDDLDAVNAMESGRMSWCLADLVEMHGDVGLDKGNGLWGIPDNCPTIYPDRDPSGKRLGDQAFPETTMSRQLEQWGLQNPPSPRQASANGQNGQLRYGNRQGQTQTPAAPPRYYSPQQRPPQAYQAQQPQPNYRVNNQPSLQPAGYQPSFSR
ncbi:MAG: secretin N-terminal domain-containing protein [Pirellulaceae bacterium]